MVKVSIIGYLGRDAILRTSKKGSFISMSIGANTGKETMWFDCTINGERPNLMPYLLRGAQVYVSGGAIFGTYTDGHGVAAAYCKIAIDTIQLTGTRQTEAAAQESASYTQEDYEKEAKEIDKNVPF